MGGDGGEGSMCFLRRPPYGIQKTRARVRATRGPRRQLPLVPPLIGSCVPWTRSPRGVQHRQGVSGVSRSYEVTCEYSRF
jgi:hypothetical protein